MNIKEGVAAIEEEVQGEYDAIVLWDIPTLDRNKLLKFCYGKSIRVYMMPKIPDVLVQGSEKMHLFDTPIFLTIFPQGGAEGGKTSDRYCMCAFAYYHSVSRHAGNGGGH